MWEYLQQLFSPEALNQVAPAATRTAAPVAASGLNAVSGNPGAGNMVDALTRMLSHPLTQGVAGGVGSAMAAPRGSTGWQQTGRGLLGGIHTMSEAQQQRQREAYQKAQIKHQTDDLAYRKDIDQQKLGLQ